MFHLNYPYTPKGDQPKAIEALSNGIESGKCHQVLLGVTGSGKTFTMANIIQKVQRPTLILTHNKTLVAQLYGEFKQFFPNNAVEYFVSYYDYYQPEAYIPRSDTYIEKDMSINQEIEKLRLSTSSSLLSRRRDVLVVASVSCIYAMGNPIEYAKGIVKIKVGQIISRQGFLSALVHAMYSRSGAEFQRGTFRVNGDTVDVYLAYVDMAYRIVFFGNEIEAIYSFQPLTGKKISDYTELAIFPANMYVMPKERLINAIHEIQDDLTKQVAYLQSIGKNLEASRLTERVNFDIEMMRELGYCSGIENYSLYFDQRKKGDRPFCLFDYFDEDYLLIIDESHVTIPQIRAMFNGDRIRKQNLIEYGFRLPSALDNRPLKFEEFEGLVNQVIYVSATPADYELEKTQGEIVEQIVRPTGLLDPPIEVRPTINQIDDMILEIRKRIQVDERILITTLTKRMAEELENYLTNLGLRCRYIHSDVDTLDRVEIIRDLRLGKFDVLIGVNLLREGLDLPEVSLVIILDADKEGFLRNFKSLTQTAGRAARNAKGLVIFYADKVTASMKKTIDETERKRKIQIQYNLEQGIVPKTILKSKEEIMKQSSVLQGKEASLLDMSSALEVPEKEELADYSKEDISKLIKKYRDLMNKASKKLDFINAALYRDKMNFYINLSEEN